eukprot:m.102939 g.102939  ORF g.102939 m.102939 type:complete len:522 (+) comp37186_c1_seq3:1097-2662(+)
MKRLQLIPFVVLFYFKWSLRPFRISKSSLPFCRESTQPALQAAKKGPQGIDYPDSPHFHIVFSTRLISTDFVTAMAKDKEAGGPFVGFLEKRAQFHFLNVLAFWFACTAHIKPEIKLLSSKFVWKLWHTYISKDAVFSIGISDAARRALKEEIDHSKGAISVNVIVPLENYSVLTLQQPWSEYLAEDYEDFVCSWEKPKIEIPDIAHPYVEEIIAVTIPSWGNTFKIGGKRKKRSKRHHLRDNPEGQSEGDKTHPSPRLSYSQQDAKKLVFSDVIQNKRVVSAFKDFLFECGEYSTFNRTQLWLDIQTLKKTSVESNKATLATSAHKTYFYEKSKRAIDLPLSLRTKLNVKTSNFCPSSGLLESVQENVHPAIEIQFQVFLQTMLQQLHPDDFESRRSLTIDDLPAVGILSESKMKRRKMKQISGKATPTAAHREELEQTLGSLLGMWPDKVNAFRSYLRQHGESDGSPLAENSFLFWTEVQKLKELCHGFADKSLIKRKADVLGDCFLDSQSPPWLQVSS